jgi:hypothetical protein
MKRALAMAVAAAGLLSGAAADNYQVDCGCDDIAVSSAGTSVSLTHDGDSGDCTPRLVGGGGDGTCLVNGDFAANFDGWSVAKESGSGGDFAFHTAGSLFDTTGDPRLPFPVTNMIGPGAYALHQSFVVPSGGTTLTFDYFALSFNPTPIDKTVMAAVTTSGGIMKVRVDLLSSDFSDWFGPTSISGVLHNLLEVSSFDTSSGSTTSKWQSASVEVPASLAGQEVILAFRESDNQAPINFAVDNVALSHCPGTMAAPSSSARRVRSMSDGPITADDDVFGPPIEDGKLYEVDE